MMINGKPRLACKTFVREYENADIIKIEPLENFPIERDLVCDISDMIIKIEQIKPYIIPKDANKPLTEDYIQSPRQLEKYRQFAQCINCGCCYAACPQYKLNKSFIGPAALSLLYRYNHDNRDAGTPQRLKIINQETGVWSCTFVGYCSDVCPKLVDPASAIQLGKGASAFDYIKHFFKKTS
jgi:fumarate reductase iron-sulfur subunit